MLIRTATAAAALLTAASLASAVGTTWTYQGTLLDGGQPANGSYDVQVQLYDAAVGGALLGTQFFNNANINRGTFTGNLDFGDRFNNGDDRWLAISIRPGPSGGALTLLTPRQPVYPTPYAMYADAANELRTRFSNGVLGAEAFVNSQAGEMLIRKDDGTIVVDFGPNASSPSGGEIKLYDDAGGLNYQVDADIAGTGEPFFQFTGPSSAVTFDGGNSGTSAVSLPTDAVSDVEIEDEPGAASATFFSTYNVVDTVGTVISRTITCPTAGYVLVIGSAELELNHTSGTTSQINFGVSDSSTSYASNTDIDFRLPSGAVSGQYITVGTSHGLFEVSAGANTFYMLADHDAGANADISDAQLTCVFISTAYGTVTPTLLAPAGDDDRPKPGVGPMTDGDLLAEREQSIADYKASVDAELKAMREDMERMRVRLEDAETRGVNAID